MYFCCPSPFRFQSLVASRHRPVRQNSSVLNQRTLQQLHEALMAVSPDVFIDTVTIGNVLDNSSTPFLDAVHSILAVKHAFGRNLNDAQAKCIEAIVRLGDADSPLQGAVDAHVLLYNVAMQAKYHAAWLKKKNRVSEIHKMAKASIFKVCHIEILLIRKQVENQCDAKEFDMVLNAAFGSISEDNDLMKDIRSQIKSTYHRVSPDDLKFRGYNELARLRRGKPRPRQQNKGMPVGAANEPEAATSDVATSSACPFAHHLAWAVNPIAHGSHRSYFPFEFEWTTAFSYYANDGNVFPFYHQPDAMLPSIFDS